VVSWLIFFFHLFWFVGDDEQSDWFADPRPDEETDLEADDPAFHILNASLDRMTEDAKHVGAQILIYPF